MSMNAITALAHRHTVDLPTSPFSSFSLSPAQTAAHDQIARILGASPAVTLLGTPGSGRSAILRRLAQELGGSYVSVKEFLAAASAGHPLAFEDGFMAVVVAAFAATPVVVIDDFEYLAVVTNRNMVRGGYLRLAAKRAFDMAVAESGRRLVVTAQPPGEGGYPPVFDVFADRSPIVTLAKFGVADYSAILANTMGAERVATLDVRTIHRYASGLNGYQLRLVSALLATQPAPTTEGVIELIARDVLQSNTRTAEIEEISFDRLPGAEHMVEALETNIVLPLENRALAQRLGLKPKRGVLLYGPPGTGKTTIGRALAHRMKGKFFMIDGSFISEPPGAFFEKVKAVVHDAKENAPSVLFIDDADVLFRIDHISGLVRYLLSLLDGLESETASNVCVMMTAMNARHVPDALLRSGRVELWLETRLPDVVNRAKILALYAGTEMPSSEFINYPDLAEATDGFTPADLRRIAGDAKALYGYDVALQRPTRHATQYLQQAVANVIADRNRMADAHGDDSVRIKTGEKYPVNTESCGWN
jgi:transitional endoplasmic reticulum ATPase